MQLQAGPGDLSFSSPAVPLLHGRKGYFQAAAVHALPTLLRGVPPESHQAAAARASCLIPCPVLGPEPFQLC